MKRNLLWVLVLLLSGTTLLSLVVDYGGGNDTRYRIVATSAQVVRNVTGAVQEWVGPVAARPVDSFCYDGVGVTRIPGHIEIRVDPVNNLGRVRAEWKDSNGTWKVTMKVFAHPEHPSGLRISSDAFQTETVILDPIVTNVYLHGNSTAGMPVLPTVFTHLACWGPVTVTLDGQPFDNPYDGPFLPQWEGHLMVTEGVRQKDGTVRNLDNSLYSPATATMGLVDHDDIEVHLTFHDARFPNVNDNFPNIFNFFYHVMFEEVEISIKHDNPVDDR